MDLTPYQRTEQLVIEAAPDALYDLVADVARMGEWSPVCTGGEYDADGQWFTGHNRIGRTTWSTRCRVAVADRGREFTFVNYGLDGTFEMVRWGFLLRATSPTTTEVTQTWEVLPGYVDGFAAEGPEAGELKDRLDFMKAMAERGMPETLESIRQAAERATADE